MFDCIDAVAGLDPATLRRIAAWLNRHAWIDDAEAGLTRPFCGCPEQMEEALRRYGYDGGSLGAMSHASGLLFAYYDEQRISYDEMSSVIDAKS